MFASCALCPVNIAECYECGKDVCNSHYEDCVECGEDVCDWCATDHEMAHETGEELDVEDEDDCFDYYGNCP